MSPEAHSGARVWPSDWFPIDEEKRQGQQHQQHIKQPDQWGQQPGGPGGAIWGDTVLGMWLPPLSPPLPTPCGSGSPLPWVPSTLRPGPWYRLVESGRVDSEWLPSREASGLQEMQRKRRAHRARRERSSRPWLQGADSCSTSTWRVVGQGREAGAEAELGTAPHQAHLWAPYSAFKNGRWTILRGSS